ncbi:GD18010 [Drosophila simulans]|uniref:GD18010 n=1 Tax=Drosophila simulans TaxID=7240 RepID=B4QYU5_DROSI|nr:GD18010 [Drosophila simulans]
MTRLLAAAAGAAALAVDNPGQAAGPDALDPRPDRAHRLAEAASPSPRMRPDGDPSMQWGKDERYLNIPCIRERR